MAHKWFMATNERASDLEVHLGYWLRFASNHVSNAFRDRIAPFDITVAEWVALRSLRTCAPCTLGALAAQIGIDAGATSRLVDRLLRKHLASRVTGTDRRAVQLDLTSAGREMVSHVAAEADHNDAAFFDPLPAADRDHLLRILKSFVAIHHLTEKPTS